MKTIKYFLLQTVLLSVILGLFSLPVSAEKQRETISDRLLFLGESTTAHLRSRGVLAGGTSTTQVLANESGTLMLNARLLSTRVIEPITRQSLTIPEAIAVRKPEFLVLSFGLNGIATFSANPGRYTELYASLIAAAQNASPETVIVLQTIYPVAKNPTEWKYDQSPGEINLEIAKLNALLPALAKQTGSILIDTASVLPDADGYLRAEYSADGIHLTRLGYLEVLNYLEEKLEEVLE